MFTHFDPMNKESYLSPENSKHAKSFLEDIRRACCVAGHIGVLTKGEDVEEADNNLRQCSLAAHLSEGAFVRLKDQLNAGIATCDLCDLRLPLPLVLPCPHLLCANCAKESFPPIPTPDELQARYAAWRTQFGDEHKVVGGKEEVEEMGDEDDSGEPRGLLPSCFLPESDAYKAIQTGNAQRKTTGGVLSPYDMWLRCTRVACPVASCGKTFRCEDVDTLQVAYSMARGDDAWTSGATSKINWLAEKLATPDVQRGCVILYSTIPEHHVIISEMLESRGVGFVRYAKSEFISDAELNLFNNRGMKRKEINREALLRFQRSQVLLQQAWLPPGIKLQGREKEDTPTSGPAKIHVSPLDMRAADVTPVLAESKFVHSPGIAFGSPADESAWQVSIEGTQIVCTQEATTVHPFGTLRLMARANGGSKIISSAMTGSVVVILAFNPSLGRFPVASMRDFVLLTEANKKKQQKRYRRVFPSLEAAETCLRALEYTSTPFVMDDATEVDSAHRLLSSLATITLLVQRCVGVAGVDVQHRAPRDGFLSPNRPLTTPTASVVDGGTLDRSTQVRDT
jgi:hypothetical protein